MKTLLVDAKNTLHRNMYNSKLTDPNGKPISGTFGMLKDISSVIRQIKPDLVVVAWDKGKCKSRLDFYPEYKANRQKNKDPEKLENIRYQTQMAKRIFKFLPVIQITLDDFEADDIIGVLCKKLAGDKIIYSNDTDFYQLISDDVTIFSSVSKKMLNKDNISEHLGFPVEKYLLHKSIVGDNSDNIKGIHRVGPKTATKYILGEKKPNFNEEQKEIIQRNLKLIKIGALVTKEDISSISKKFKDELVKTISTGAVKKTFIELGFKSLVFNFTSLMSDYAILAKKFKRK